MSEIMKKLGQVKGPSWRPEPEAELEPEAFEPDAHATSFVAEPRPDEKSLVDALTLPPKPKRPALTVDDTTATWDPKSIDPAAVAFHNRCSSICEQYRTIRARLLTLNSQHKHQVLAITSAVPREGKSVSAVNLGLVMAEGGEHRILIVDADFRRTSIATMLGIDESPGLVNVLRGEVKLADALRATPLPNLKVVTAGVAKDKNYAELLGGSAAREVFRQLRDAFDYTFLDTPPVTTVADMGLLAPHCDGALVVIHMRRTPEPAVHQAVRTLQTSDLKILGCILSRFRDQRTHYYGRYYNYY